MERTQLRVAALAVVAAVGAGSAGLLGGATTIAGPPDTVAVTQAQRAAGPRFAPEVAARDREWMLASIARARPEAQRLIAEIDGLIVFRTHSGDPVGVTRSLVGPGGASFEIGVDAASLNGLRTVDRDVTMLHELGHVIDVALVPAETNAVLEAGIPRTGTCDHGGVGLVGSCTEPVERFADTFAKWALRGRVSVVGAGYGVATPPSLDGWGAPLGTLAAGLPAA